MRQLGEPVKWCPPRLRVFKLRLFPNPRLVLFQLLLQGLVRGPSVTLVQAPVVLSCPWAEGS